VASRSLEYDAKINLDVSEVNKFLKDFQSGVEGAGEKLNQVLGGSVTKKVVLETRVDESGAKKLVAVEKERLSVTQSITAEVRKLTATEAGSVTSLRQQVNQAKQVRDQIAKYKSEVNALGASVSAINPRWQAQAQQVASLQNALDRASASGFWDKIKVGLRAQGVVNFANGLNQLTTSLQSASILVGQLTGSINTLIRTKGDLDAFAFSFKAIGVGASEAAGLLKESERIATGLGTRIGLVQDSFRQLSPVILNSGGTLEDVSAIVEAMSSRFAAFDIAGDRARRIMNGIIQAFAKGKLQAEELTQQISEAEPAFKTDFANALGVSTAELEKLVQAGKITVDVLIDTLPKLSKASLVYGKLGSSALDAAAALGKGNVTIDQARDNISTFNELNLRGLALGLEPAIIAFIKLQATVTDFISDALKLSSFDAITNLVSGLVSAVQRAVAGIAALGKALLTVLEPIAKLVNAFLEIPGAAEGVGLAILAKAIGPLAALKASLVKSGGALTGFGGVLKGAVDFPTFFNGISGLIRGSNQVTAEIAKTSKTISTLGNASDFAKGRLATLSKQLETAKARLATLQSQSGTVFGVGTSAAEIKSLQEFIPALTRQVGRYEDAITRAGVKTTNATAKVGALSAIAARGGGVFNAFGKAISGSFNLIGKGLAFAAGAGKALLATLGPIGVALALVAVGQAAYGNATKESSRRSQEAADKLKEYKGLLEEISGVKVAEPKLEGLALAWERFSLAVADAVDESISSIDRFVNYVNSIDFSRLGKLFSFAFPQGFENTTIGRAFQIPSEDEAAVEAQIKRFTRNFKVSSQAIVDQSEEVKSLAARLTEQAAKTEESADAQQKFSSNARALSRIVSQLGKDYRGVQKEYEDFKRELGDDVTPEQAAALAELGAKAKAAGDAYREAAASYSRFSEETGRAQEAINESIFSLGALNEQLKTFRDELNNADPSSVEFGRLIVDIAALEAGLARVQDRAKDPIELLVKTDARLKEKTAELNKLFETQRRIQEELADAAISDPSGISAGVQKLNQELEEAQKKIPEIARDIDNLLELEGKITLELELQDIAFRNQLEALKNDRTLVDIKLSTTIDQPTIRNVRSQIVEFRSELQGLFAQQEELARRIQDPTTGTTERVQLAREQAVTALQIENAARNASATLKDLAAQLARDLGQARTGLLALAQQGREKGLQGGAQSLKLQAEAARALDAELQKIANQRGISLAFRGTPEEILKAKLETVQFYRELEKAENQVKDLSTGVSEVDKFLEAITQSGLGEIFEAMATAAQSLAGGSAEAATNSSNIASALSDGASQARDIVNAITSLDGMTVSIKVNSIPGLWTGGPAQAGQTYQVNELGQEGFLSATGRLSPINKPRNALWKAPSSGTVIPANLWSNMNIPKAGIQTTQRPIASVAAGGDGELANISRQIQMNLMMAQSSQNNDELASVQAQQALEIGKLGRAVEKLTSKKWNVQVGVTNTGNSAYLSAVNHRL
jgi:tape measure domain-containing protein